MSWWQDCGQYINPWQWKYIDKQLSLHSVSSVSHECLLWVTKNRISCWIANLQFWIATYGQLFQLANATRWMKRLHGNLMSLISWRKHMTGVASSMCASSRNVIIPTPTARSKNSPRVHTHVRKYHTCQWYKTENCTKSPGRLWDGCQLHRNPMRINETHQISPSWLP